MSVICSSRMPVATTQSSTIDSPADRSSQAGAVVVLAALARAFPRAPVWVADDGSTDATAQIAREAGAHVVGSATAIGKGAAVTRAAREAWRDAQATAGGSDIET